MFPADIVSPKVTSCDAVYSILLLKESDDHPDAHNVVVGGVRCVTLGHGVTRGDCILAHAFFGDYEQVTRNLSSLEGFHDNEGVIECLGTTRGTDGRICGFICLDQSKKQSVQSLESVSPFKLHSLCQ